MKSNNLKLVFINLFLIVLALVTAEFFATKYFKSEFKNFKKKILIYSQDKVFENYEDIFLHKKNTNFISSTFYFDEDKKEIINEYNYKVSTNNEGLVQKKDIQPEKKTIFVLGASEAKGQGATPWFYDFEKTVELNNDIQILNVAFIGTGPAQQIKIMNLIKEKYNLSVSKIIFIITPGELNRNIWNFNEQQLRCLKDHTKCIGTENIYGYDFNLLNEKKFAEKIYAIKGGERNSVKPFLNALNQGNYFQAIKELAKNSYLIKKLYLSLFKSKSMLNSGEENFEEIKKIVKLYKDQVFILHPNNKGQTNPEDSELVIKLVKNLNLKNNYFYCQIPPLKGFHKNDSHPNELGYSKLKDCLIKVLDS